MLKDKLRRIQDLYGVYQINEQTMLHTKSKGSQASIRRNQVFLKEKITSLLKDIKLEMQPNLFVVALTNHRGEPKTVIMRADTFDDINTYINLLQLIHQEAYYINHITHLDTIYNEHIKIVVTR